MRIKGKSNDALLWWAGDGFSFNESDAVELNRVEAERRLRIINANNRFLDREDRVEAMIEETK